MKRLILYLIVTVLTFFIGIVVTVFWIFQKDVQNVPAIYSDKLLVPNSEKNELEKIKLKFYKERLEEFTEFKKFRKTRVLKKIREQPLEKITDPVNESYRFFWIPSFNSPVVIRIWRADNKNFLVVKEVKSDNLEIKEILYEKTKSLTDKEWMKFLELLNQ